MIEFAQLLSPTKEKEFFYDYWEKKCLLIKRKDTEFYCPILSFDDLSKYLQSNLLRYPSVRLVKEGTELALNNYSYDFSYGNASFENVIDIDSLFKHFYDGLTIVLQATHKEINKLGKLCSNIEKSLKFPVQTNIYITPPNSKGFEKHWDTHDVFILQVSGSKNWKIYNSPLELPTATEKYQRDIYQFSAPDIDATLQPGDLLYIPRGFVHEAFSTDEISSHITVGVLSYTYNDILRAAIKKSTEDIFFRRSIPFDYNEKSQEIKDDIITNMEHLIGNMDFSKILTSMHDSFIESSNSIPVNRLVDSSKVEKINLATILKRNELIIVRKEDNGVNVTLKFLKKKITFPSYINTTIDYILENPKFVVNDISNDLDENGKIVLCKKLIKEGLLNIKE